MEELLIDHESFQLTQMDFLIRLAVGLGIGFLIGLEREHAALTKTIKPFAGIRTIILVVLYSFLTMMFYYLLSPWILIVSLMGLFGLVSFSFFIVHNDDAVGTTSVLVITAFFFYLLKFLGLS